MNYKKYNDTGAVQNDNGEIIFPGSAGWDKYLEWVAAGGILERADQPPIELRRAEVWAKVKSKRAQCEAGDVFVQGNWFQVDADSRIRMMRLEMKAIDLTTAGAKPDDVLAVAGYPISWKTSDNKQVPMTVSLAIDLPGAIEILDAMAFGRSAQLSAEIEKSDDPESIDIESGWPKIYEP